MRGNVRDADSGRLEDKKHTRQEDLVFCWVWLTWAALRSAINLTQSTYRLRGTWLYPQLQRRLLPICISAHRVEIQTQENASNKQESTSKHQSHGRPAEADGERSCACQPRELSSLYEPMLPLIYVAF